MPNQENNPEILPSPTNNQKKEPKLLRKTLEAITLCEAGLSPREALQVANMTTKISASAVSNFKAKLKKHSLTEPGTVKLASAQIRRILKARAREVVKEKVVSTTDGIETIKEITQYIHPTDNNILAAASMVYDRYEPARGNDQPQAGGVNYLDLSSITVNVQAQDGR